MDQNKIGIVVIGRNEGMRLNRCLNSVKQHAPAVVYVDSGSIDGSPALARSLGFRVLELNSARPFSAARARNEGFRLITKERPNLEYIQFVDADCELNESWISAGTHALAFDASLAIACGRLRELEPNRSIYARLCDMEWAAKPGLADYCGGIFMIRATAFNSIGGFNESMIAGEDPELCVRLRLEAWSIKHLDSDMAIHDSAMTGIHQWWKRSLRSGFGYAEGAAMHGSGQTHHWVRQCRSNWLWGALLPTLLLGTAVPTGSWSLGLFAIYPIQVARVAAGRQRQWHDRWAHAWLYGVFVMAGKFPCALGQVKYWFNRVQGRQSAIIEHKSANADLA